MTVHVDSTRAIPGKNKTLTICSFWIPNSVELMIFFSCVAITSVKTSPTPVMCQKLFTVPPDFPEFFPEFTNTVLKEACSPQGKVDVNCINVSPQWLRDIYDDYSREFDDCMTKNVKKYNKMRFCPNDSLESMHLGTDCMQYYTTDSDSGTQSKSFPSTHFTKLPDGNVIKSSRTSGRTTTGLFSTSSPINEGIMIPVIDKPTQTPGVIIGSVCGGIVALIVLVVVLVLVRRVMKKIAPNQESWSMRLCVPLQCVADNRYYQRIIRKKSSIRRPFQYSNQGYEQEVDNAPPSGGNDQQQIIEDDVVRHSTRGFRNTKLFLTDFLQKITGRKKDFRTAVFWTSGDHENCNGMGVKIVENNELEKTADDPMRGELIRGRRGYFIEPNKVGPVIPDIVPLSEDIDDTDQGQPNTTLEVDA